VIAGIERPLAAAPGLDLDPGRVWPPGRSADGAVVSVVEPMLGGSVAVHLRGAGTGPSARALEPSPWADGRSALARMRAWAGRLTRFDASSELSALNADPRTEVPIGPTLAAVLDWGREAESATSGLVDITLLDARLAAQHGTVLRTPAHRAWSLERRREGAVVRRPPGVRFDLDGVAKGWLADRALARLDRHASALVDADGDVAIRLAPATTWSVGVADPRIAASHLLVLALPTGADPARYGIATSGTSIHRWSTASGPTHHLIDPSTGLPARTDLVQVTVVGRTARHAEAFAKAAVIAGRDRGLALLDRDDLIGAVLLTEGGDLLVTSELTRWIS
jgi:thiamine biosynthesis lipoprotein